MSHQTTFVAEFVETIAPFLADKSSRVAALRTAFPGDENLKGLQCEGNVADVLPNLLGYLDVHGRLGDGRIPLVAFIDALKPRCGTDVQDRLTELQRAYIAEYEVSEAKEGERRSKQTLVRITRRRSLALAIGMAVGIALMAVVAYTPTLYRTWNPPRYQVDFSSLSPQFSASVSEPDETNSGITIEETALTVDMRPEVSVAMDERDLRINPSTHTYSIRAVRREDSAKIFVLAFASQRPNMDVVCLNHQFEVRRSRSAHIAGKGFENVWHLLVDVSDRSLNIPFEIKVRAVRWNAYQADDENYVGKIVSGNEKQFTLRVLLPDVRQLRERPVLQQHPKSPSPPIEAFAGDGELSISSDQKSFEWKVVEPRQGFVYRAKILWESASGTRTTERVQRWSIISGTVAPVN